MQPINIEALSTVTGGAGRVKVPNADWMNLMLGNAQEVSALVSKYGKAITEGKMPKSIINAGVPTR